MTTSLPLPLAMLEERLGYDEGTLDGPDRTRAEHALADATTLALDEAPAKVAARWATALPATVALVILKAARREFENPQGLRSENTGDQGGTFDVASGVYLTPHEGAIVRRAATGRRGGFTGSVRTPSAYVPDVDVDAVLVAPVVMAGEDPAASLRDGVRLLAREDLP